MSIGSKSPGPVVSSAHLASGALPVLSEFEFGLILVSHAFHRWMIRGMGRGSGPVAHRCSGVAFGSASLKAEAPSRCVPGAEHRGHTCRQLFREEARAAQAGQQPQAREGKAHLLHPGRHEGMRAVQGDTGGAPGRSSGLPRP
jgi:hypothetical protein